MLERLEDTSTQASDMMMAFVKDKNDKYQTMPDYESLDAQIEAETEKWMLRQGIYEYHGAWSVSWRIRSDRYHEEEFLEYEWRVYPRTLAILRVDNEPYLYATKRDSVGSGCP